MITIGVMENFDNSFISVFRIAAKVAIAEELARKRLLEMNLQEVTVCIPLLLNKRSSLFLWDSIENEEERGC